MIGEETPPLLVWTRRNTAGTQKNSLEYEGNGERGESSLLIWNAKETSERGGNSPAHLEQEGTLREVLDGSGSVASV